MQAGTGNEFANLILAAVAECAAGLSAALLISGRVESRPLLTFFPNRPQNFTAQIHALITDVSATSGSGYQSAKAFLNAAAERAAGMPIPVPLCLAPSPREPTSVHLVPLLGLCHGEK
jgi:hypothetical protein